MRTAIAATSAAGFVPTEYPGEDTARFLATIHPSAVLRSDDRERAYRGFVDDLTVVAEILGDAG